VRLILREVSCAAHHRLRRNNLSGNAHNAPPSARAINDARLLRDARAHKRLAFIAAAIRHAHHIFAHSGMCVLAAVHRTQALSSNALAAPVLGLPI